MFRKISLLIAFLCCSYWISAQNDLFQAIRNGEMKTVQKIIRATPDSLHVLNTSGFTPLMIACYRDQTKIAQFLVNKGADVNQISSEGTALQAAVYKQNVVLTQFLIQKKAKLDVQAPDGNTALMYAVLAGNEELVRVLIQANASKSISNKDGQTALTLATALKNERIVALLSGN